MPEIVTYVIDDEAEIRSSIVQFLELSGKNVEEFASADLALAKISRESAIVIVSDIRMPGIDGMELLRRVMATDPNLPVILITGHGDVAMAVEAMKLGAYDFIEKPFDPEALVAKIERASKSRALTLDNRILRSALSNPERLRHVIVGNSDIAENIRNQVLEFAQVDNHILIMGETGTGRSLAARAIQAASPYAKYGSRVVNCAAHEESELEEMIFSNPAHGAPFLSPSPMTLVLDNINNLPTKLQERLSFELDKFDDIPHIRIIAIQNASDEDELVESLKYHLQGKNLYLPPLRDRGADILAIFTKYCKHFAQDYGNDIEELTAHQAALLMAGQWTGNVRQLTKLAERIAMNDDPEKVDRLIEEEIGDHNMGKIQNQAPLKSQVDAFEEMLIRNSLTRHNGSIAAVLEELSLPRRTLNEKMARYGLSRGDFVS